MRKVIQALPNTSSRINNYGNKRIYTRFHRKPQIYPTTFQTNRLYKVETTNEEENMNNYISDIYKEKKYRGVLDPGAPNNKNIFIDTDSEHQKSEIEPDKISIKNKKSAKLLIAKTESQYPDTYNSENIFTRDGLVKGYFIKVNENNNLKNNSREYINLTKNSRKVKFDYTPSPESEAKYIYNNYNKKTEQMRTKKINLNNLNQTYNRNTLNNGFFKKEIDLDEWPSVDKSHNAKLYFRNKDIQLGEIKTDNSNNIENENINAYQVKKYPAGMVYQKSIVPDANSKSNISDNSEDYLNQYKKIPIENNYVIAGNTSETGSPIGYKNNNNYILGTSEDDSEQHVEIAYYNDGELQNYMNKRIIKADNDTFGHGGGGKVDLYYGLNNYNKGNNMKNNYIITKKNNNINLINEIKNDRQKLNSLIQLQRFIRSYLYLRELCAMKIQAIWRGGNTRRIMDLYNDLDEFIYHLSKVQFNHFNNNFCFFIKQLFNIYKANVSNGYLENEEIENNENNNDEEENDIENENCMNQFTLEEIEKKNGTDEYIYKYPEGSCFDPEKLELENEIALFVEASSPYYERKSEYKSKEYERLIKDYEELYQQYNELKQNNPNANTNNLNINYHFVPKKEKNESESAFGSNKKEIKFHKVGSIKRDNNQKDSEKIQKTIGKNKNSTISNDYDADLDINRDDDFFNQELSYDDKDNTGSLIKDKRYSYFSLHSDENSKYFDNENPKEKEIKEGEIFKINISKNSGGSKYNNNSTKNTAYTGYTGTTSRQEKSKLTGLQKSDKINTIEHSNSPSIEKSNNYIGHHSKTFPRKFKNYTDSNKSALIIPKHEEDFNIIHNKLFLSPKERDNKINIKNNRSDIAITPAIKFEDKNWNEIIEYIKNEEIEIPTQKRIKNKFINDKIFDVLAQEKNNEININNEEYKQKKLEQIYIQHENELNIFKVKTKADKVKDNSLIKSIEEKDNQINIIKKKLEEITEKLKNAKMFDNKLEINNNLNTLNIKGIKPFEKKRIFDKINIDKINIKRKPRKLISYITKNNNFSINDLQTVPETVEEITDTNDLIPKEIKITTKKIVKKVDTIQYKFKNNLITTENAININGKEKLLPIFEEECQENNRFSVDKTIKEENAEKEKIIQDNAVNKLNEILKEDNEGNVLKVKVINLEDLKVIKPFSYVITSGDENIKDKKEKEIFEIMKNNEISLNPIAKREIKIVTKKILKKTNIIHSKFGDNKTIVSIQNQLDIKGNEKEEQPEIITQEKIMEEQKVDEIKLEQELPSQRKELEKEKINEMTFENKIGKKFENIQLPNEEDNNRFCIENELEMPKIYKIVKINKPSEIVINRKSQFTINGNKKKSEENIINTKSKFTINGIQKEKIESKEEGVQFENNYDNLSEKMTDTNDLIPKQIKITTKKIVKKTNILKKYNNNIVSPQYNINLEGTEKPEIEQETIKSDDKDQNKEIIKTSNWNNLQKEGQQYNFFIKRISKNIYKKYEALKNLKEKEKELSEQKDEQKEDKKDINIQEEKEKEIPKEIIKTITVEKDWNKILEKENQQNINIESNNKYIPKTNENIIVKKINFNIINNKEIQKEESEPKPEQIIYQSNWKDSLIADSQQNNIIIKGQEKTDKKNINIHKNIVLNIEPTNGISLAKNKIMENWNDSNVKQNSEELNIENTKKKEIRITTRKIMKKTNNIYRKFGNLDIVKNELDIKGEKIRVKCEDFITENIRVNINKTYEPKKMENLEMEKNKEIFINANDYKKKEIKIRTKKTISKTNYVYKRFTNNTISNQNSFIIENMPVPNSTIISSFGNEKLEKVELPENKFTINKSIDNAKEQELKDKLQKETEANLEMKYQKEKEDLKKEFETQNNELKKENEELKNKLEQQKEQEQEKDIKTLDEKEKEKEKKQNTFNDLQPIATDEFGFEMEYNSEENEEKNEISDNVNENENENEKYYEDRDNKIEYDMEHIELIVEGGNKKPIELSEQGIKTDEEKPKTEEIIDTFDLENKETQVPFEKILKKTNVLNEFKNNSICSDTKLNINTPSKDKKFIINKVFSFTLNKPGQKLIEKENNKEINQNDINTKNNIQVPNIRLSYKKMHKPTDKKITEKTFGDSNQLSNVLLRSKPNKKITDQKERNTITFQTASFEHILNIVNDDEDVKDNEKDKEKGKEDEKNLYKKRKVLNRNLMKIPSKRKKFSSLVIKLDNKSGVYNCFNKWNTLTPNLLIKKEENINDKNKNKSINIKQIVKEKNNNLKIKNIDNNINNERYTDTTNIEKSNEDSNQIKTTDNNFETISLEIPSSTNANEDNDNINKSNKKKKIKIIKKNNTNEDIDKELDTNININNEENLKKMNNNLNNINNDMLTNEKRNSINSNPYSSNDDHSQLNSISNDISSSIEIIEKSDKNDQDNSENPEQQPEEPKKKEILINKKICIVSKKPRIIKIKFAEAKKKFFLKRFMIKFWKIWKNNVIKEKEKEREFGKMKSLESKSKQKPFNYKKKIQKRIIQSEVNKEQQILSLKNKLMSQNKELIIRHFFLKWNKDIVNESNEFKDISIIENILRRHLVRYLAMIGKFLKFKKLLIKYALNRRHK